MSVLLLREISIEEITHSLAKIINTCLSLVKFHDALKIVVPVNKKGNGSLGGSYRPTAIIPAIAKVFETVSWNMKVQLLDLFEAKNLFCEAQYGF